MILSIYGLFEANNIKIEKVTINTYKLPPSVDVFRIVHISDVHLGPLVKERKLREMIKLIEKASPDILVATGDIVDGQINNHPDYIKPFLILNPRYGKYAVLGNHELYVGLEQSIDYLQKAGFMVLRNEGFSIQGIINIAGIDDPSVKFFLKSNISEKNILSKLSQGEFTIFLKHRPIVSSDYIDLFDLQLSGHSHKGQIFPLNLITKFYYDVHGGLARLSDRSYIYVSRGVGTSGPPIRILSPPEITVIDIVRKQ
ncbi:MAG: metallophosphoesterase [Thermodesulfovibrionales bacterium]|nr:metallophosphoesterase [Thermodesulfovibrionales bacterium]